MPNASDPRPQKPLQKWEDLAEKRIRDSQAQGDFDGVAYGQPLPDEAWSEDWLTQKLKREQIAMLPPGLALRAEFSKRLEAAMAQKKEPDARKALEELNIFVRKEMYTVIWGPPANVQPVDIEAKLKEWRAARDS
jgi:hypothetical protein